MSQKAPGPDNKKAKKKPYMHSRNKAAVVAPNLNTNQQQYQGCAKNYTIPPFEQMTRITLCQARNH